MLPSKTKIKSEFKKKVKAQISTGHTGNTLVGQTSGVICGVMNTPRFDEINAQTKTFHDSPGCIHSEETRRLLISTDFEGKF